MNSNSLNIFPFAGIFYSGPPPFSVSLTEKIFSTKIQIIVEWFNLADLFRIAFFFSASKLIHICEILRYSKPKGG